MDDAWEWFSPPVTFCHIIMDIFLMILENWGKVYSLGGTSVPTSDASVF